MYLTNDIVKQVVLHNEYGRIRLNAAGTKVLAKQEAGKGVDAQFRILGEGLPVVLPFTDPATILSGDLETLKILVQSYYPLCSSFSEPFKSVIEEKRECFRLHDFLVLIQVQLRGAISYVFHPKSPKALRE